MVHRPSPESETLPANCVSSGSSVSAAAVKSSNHDAITLPRRHTSVNVTTHIVRIYIEFAIQFKSKMCFYYGYLYSS